MPPRDELDRLHDAIEKFGESLDHLRAEAATQALHIAVLKSEFAQQKSGNASLVAIITSILTSVLAAAAIYYLKLK